MALSDLRSLVASWVRSRNGRVDPAVYTAQYKSTDLQSGQLSIKPDGKRGVFLAFGLARPRRDTGDALSSKVSLQVDSRRLTYTPVMRGAVAHNDVTGVGAGGIQYSAWPAPVFIPQDAAFNVTEQIVVSGSPDLAGNVYALAGFHTSIRDAEDVLSVWGELRAFAFDVQMDAARNGGNASQPFSLPEQDRRVWVSDFCVANVDSAPGDLDFVQLRMRDAQLYSAQRVSGTLSLALPQWSGTPLTSVGRYLERGDTMTVQERISSTTRRDVWTFLSVAGGNPAVVEVGGIR